MTSLSIVQRKKLLAGTSLFSMTSPEERIEDFVSRRLGFTLFERTASFSGPDGDTFLSIVIAELTRERERILREKCEIPNFMVYQNTHKVWQISGLDHYLNVIEPASFSSNFKSRIRSHSLVRKELMSFHRGQELEALGAVLLEALCGFGEATIGTGDQGIDAIGRKELLAFQRVFYTGASVLTSLREPVPGNNVFILASAKANLGVEAGAPSLISPAHIRELVGGWLIQRDDVGKWRESGIRMLTPVQMLLITTYRLSDESISDCLKLGIHVWTLPQLICLICEHAPSSVFDLTRPKPFYGAKFREWWRAKSTSRLGTASTLAIA